MVTFSTDEDMDIAELLEKHNGDIDALLESEDLDENDLADELGEWKGALTKALRER